MDETALLNLFSSFYCMGVARGKLRWGSFPKGHNLGAGRGAEPHIALLAKFFLHSLNKIFDFNALLCLFASCFINIFNL